MAVTKSNSPKRIKIPSLTTLEDSQKFGPPSLGDHKYTDDELEEIIDAAVNLMEFALQRKSFPVADHTEPKKRLPADKLLYIYHDMQAHQDHDSDSDSCGDPHQEEQTLVEVNGCILCTECAEKETPKNDTNESQQPLV